MKGIIAKDLGGAYHVATRDPSWVKSKPEITLDLVITGALWRSPAKRPLACLARM